MLHRQSGVALGEACGRLCQARGLGMLGSPQHIYLINNMYTYVEYAPKNSTFLACSFIHIDPFASILLIDFIL